MTPAMFLLAALSAGPGDGGWLQTTTQNDGGGLPIAWASREVGYYLGVGDAGGADIPNGGAQTAIRASFTTWMPENVNCNPDGQGGTIDGGTNSSYMTFRELGSTTAPVLTSQDTKNHIYFVESGWANVTGHSPTAIALTTVGFYVNTGQIVDADMELNGTNFTFTIADGGACGNRQDVQNTATHEIGHMIGLNHPPAPESTMYASAPACEIKKRTLHQNDMDGICAIYGAPAPEAGGGGCCKNEIGSGSPNVLGPLAMVLALLALWLRRKVQI